VAGESQEARIVVSSDGRMVHRRIAVIRCSVGSMSEVRIVLK
jgi:hypothetical protein